MLNKFQVKLQNTTIMKNKVILVLSVLFGLMFINSGLNKFFAYMPMPDEMPQGAVALMEAMASVGWLFPLVGVVEVVGGLLFITNKYRALGAIIIFPVMVGVLLTHIVNIPGGLPLALVLFAINAWVMIENREKYAPLFQ